MITKIHLENYKGIKERQIIEFKRITLLFGANSCGKSTIIHALYLLKKGLQFFRPLCKNIYWEEDLQLAKK